MLDPVTPEVNHTECKSAALGIQCSPSVAKVTHLRILETVSVSYPVTPEFNHTECKLQHWASNAALVLTNVTRLRNWKQYPFPIRFPQTHTTNQCLLQQSEATPPLTAIAIIQICINMHAQGTSICSRNSSAAALTQLDTSESSMLDAWIIRCPLWHRVQGRSGHSLQLLRMLYVPT
jgi:hypothetical protein